MNHHTTIVSLHTRIHLKNIIKIQDKYCFIKYNRNQEDYHPIVKLTTDIYNLKNGGENVEMVRRWYTDLKM